MSHLGLRILYHVINSRDDASCERVFAPWDDMERLMRAHGIPLFALESRDELRDFDILGFTLQYELSYSNVLNMLDLAGINPLARERGEDGPLVCAGGPCACNPMPMAPFIDFFVLGEGEEAIGDILDLYRSMKDEAAAAGKPDSVGRAEFLRRARLIDGVYVPSAARARTFGPAAEPAPASISAPAPASGAASEPTSASEPVSASASTSASVSAPPSEFASAPGAASESASASGPASTPTSESAAEPAPAAEPVPMEARARKRVVADMDAAPFPDRGIVPFGEIVHDRVMLELFRGCIRGCRFCQAGYIYRPVRQKKPGALVEQACALVDSTGYEEISLTSLSTSDYSGLRELTDTLVPAM
ncbi:MAG: hypothetical protein LBJ10_07945, partial [Clostridiales bacterium]|nr:hypothetical protein [Clostridiales bacterium]